MRSILHGRRGSVAFTVTSMNQAKLSVYLILLDYLVLNYDRDLWHASDITPLTFH